MISGIEPTQEVRDTFAKLNKSKIKAFTVKIDKIEGKDQMLVDKVFEKEGFTFEAFAEAFPELESRIGVIEVEIPREDSRTEYKIVDILWSPINAPALKKMKYSTSISGFRGEFTQIHKSLQLDSKADLAEEPFMKRVKA